MDSTEPLPPIGSIPRRREGGREEGREGGRGGGKQDVQNDTIRGEYGGARL
jgi:hypothetical protein